jgi:hypothetical protein
MNWISGLTGTIARPFSAHIAAEKMIRRVERKYGFESGVSRVVPFPTEGGFYRYRSNWIGGGIVKVPVRSPRSRALREYTFHEMGHAICDYYSVEEWLTPFTRRVQSTDEEYERASADAALRARRDGFVSGDATCNREEDFCETLSAYICNVRTWRRSIVFERDHVDVRRDARLRRKLDAVHELLEVIGTFE